MAATAATTSRGAEPNREGPGTTIPDARMTPRVTAKIATTSSGKIQPAAACASCERIGALASMKYSDSVSPTRRSDRTPIARSDTVIASPLRSAIAAAYSTLAASSARAPENRASRRSRIEIGATNAASSGPVTSPATRPRMIAGARYSTKTSDSDGVLKLGQRVATRSVASRTKTRSPPTSPAETNVPKIPDSLARRELEDSSDAVESGDDSPRLSDDASAACMKPVLVRKPRTMLETEGCTTVASLSSWRRYAMS